MGSHGGCGSDPKLLLPFFVRRKIFCSPGRYCLPCQLAASWQQKPVAVTSAWLEMLPRLWGTDTPSSRVRVSCSLCPGPATPRPTAGMGSWPASGARLPRGSGRQGRSALGSGLSPSPEESGSAAGSWPGRSSRRSCRSFPNLPSASPALLPPAGPLVTEHKQLRCGDTSAPGGEAACEGAAAGPEQVPVIKTTGALRLCVHRARGLRPLLSLIDRAEAAASLAPPEPQGLSELFPSWL